MQIRHFLSDQDVNKSSAVYWAPFQFVGVCRLRRRTVICHRTQTNEFFSSPTRRLIASESETHAGEVTQRDTRQQLAPKADANPAACKI